MKKAFLFGTIGFAGLLGIFFLITSLISGKAFALEQFWRFWPYLMTLAIGFGVQIFLLIRLHQKHCERGGGVVAMSGTTSGIAMISCCSHYFLNFLPLLSGAGLSTLVGQYQIEIFLVGIALNFVGIMILLRKISHISL